MRKISRNIFAAASLLLLGVAPANAQMFQPQFGRAVGIDGGQVLIMKANGRGPSAVYVFSQTDSGWEETARLGDEVTGATGEALSASLHAGAGRVFIGSGSPDESSYALSYALTDEDEWKPSTAIGSGAAPAETAAFDLQGLMKILRPPQRVVAVDGDVMIVASLGQSTTVDALVRSPETGEWIVDGSLEPTSGGTGGGFGSALLIAGGHVLVGAPLQESGIVYAFSKGADGWSETGRIDGADFGEVRRFGAALAEDGAVTYVGAPGTGADVGKVIVLSRSDANSWDQLQQLSAPASTERNRFGTALAATGSLLWVGAPGDREGAGSVHVFAWNTNGEAAALAGLPQTDVGPGAGLGSSIAAASNIAVAGAPTASGGFGRAVVYSRGDAGNWSASEINLPGELSTVAGDEVRCAEGEAAGFSCEGVDLLSFLTIDALGGRAGETVSDIWGWTDPQTGREYALIGRAGGLVMVDVSNPSEPSVRGIIEANPSIARDIKVYADHVFFTGDGAQNHGLIVFDLTRLRDLTEVGAVLEPDAVYEGIASAHNLAIDTESGFAYALGASGGGETCGGGLHMIDIRNPIEPTFAGCYTDTEGLIFAGRTHDTQCTVYRGPDADYYERQICFASNETALRIVDVTDKQNPVPIAAASFPAQAYIHQGWLTEDHRFFYLDDELDELIGNTERTRTLIWDLTDLDDPTYAGDLLGPDAATDHNMYVKGDRLYQANYEAGLRVVDISSPTEPVEVGHFDTTPYGPNPPGFSGAWSVFPYFESGTIIVSSITEGLFVLRPDRPLVP